MLDNFACQVCAQTVTHIAWTSEKGSGYAVPCGHREAARRDEFLTRAEIAAALLLIGNE